MPLHFPTPKLLQQGFVHDQIERIHDALSAERGAVTSVIDGVEHDAAFVSAVRDALAQVLAAPPEPDRGEYYSHNPLVSLVQSVVDEELAQQRLVGAAEHDQEAMGQPFTKWDLVGWGGDILLSPWPVPPAIVGDVPSWALNGNHDMYSGGHGLFETTLRGSAWNVLALDNAWKDKLIEFDRASGQLKIEGALGHLTEEIVPLLGDRVVDAWFWGHEHDCMAYEPMPNVRYARSIGNRAVPEVIRSGEATPLNADGSLVKPVPSDELPEDHPQRHVSWEYRGFRIGADGERWMKHGFAVLDFAGEHITARYIDDEGNDIVDAETLQ